MAKSFELTVKDTAKNFKNKSIDKADFIFICKGVDDKEFFGDSKWKQKSGQQKQSQLEIKLSQKNLNIIKKNATLTPDNKYFVTENDITIKFTISNKKRSANNSKRKSPAPISTAQQEAITLKILEQKLNKGTKHYKTFEDMYNDPKSGLKKIHSSLNVGNLEKNEWWQSFNAQFEGISDIIKAGKLKEDHYEVFNLDGKQVSDKNHNFMQFISDLITTGTGGSLDAASIQMFAKKDSWNPADIWLLDTQGNPKGTYAQVKEKLKKATTIAEINKIMQIAYRDRIIKGISLKKNRGSADKLIFEEVNLFKMHTKGSLPNVVIKQITYDPHYNKGTKVFSSVTSVLTFQDVKSKELYDLAFRSNQSNLSNITFEFKEQGMPAQLGKIPKDRMLDAISKLNKSGVPKEFPSVSDHSDYDRIHWNKVHKIVGVFLKQSNVTWKVGDQSKQYDIPYSEWKKSSKLKGKAAMEQYKKQKEEKTNENKEISYKRFKENLEESIKKHGIVKGNSILMQMTDFLYLFAKLKNAVSEEVYIKFLTNLFYWAQKKGQEWQFGPFGKLA